MNRVHFALAGLLVLAAGSALADDPKATIAALGERLAKIGAPKLEGTEKAGDKTVPRAPPPPCS